MCYLILTRYTQCRQRYPHIGFEQCTNFSCKYDDFAKTYGLPQHSEPVKRLILLSDTTSECPQCCEKKEKSVVAKLRNITKVRKAFTWKWEGDKEGEDKEGKEDLGKGNGEGEGKVEKKDGLFKRGWKALFGSPYEDGVAEMEDIMELMYDHQKIEWF